MSAAPTPYRGDSRGGRLEAWEAVVESGSHVVWLRGPDGAARQLLALGAGYQHLPIPAAQAVRYTHVLRGPGQPLPVTSQLLDHLMGVITLPPLVNVDAAIALDWYKIKNDNAPPAEWNNTPTGQLINNGKYRYVYDDQKVRQAGNATVQLVCAALDANNVLGACPTVAYVPGHDTTQLSFGSRLAAAVARQRGKNLVQVAASAQFRPSMKTVPADERPGYLRDYYSIDTNLSGQPLLVIDDVFQSGASMDEIARIAKCAGASTVYGLTAVRTMSSGRY